MCRGSRLSYKGRVGSCRFPDSHFPLYKNGRCQWIVLASLVSASKDLSTITSSEMLSSAASRATAVLGLLVAGVWCAPRSRQEPIAEVTNFYTFGDR